MNTRLLRMAERHKGTWRWVLPGYPHAIRYVPAHRTPPGWSASLSFPFQDGLRVLDLGRHRWLAKQCIRALTLSGRPAPVINLKEANHESQ